MRLNFRYCAVLFMALALLCSCARPASGPSGPVELSPAVHKKSLTVSEVQQMLLAAGYKPGPVDGIMGGKTRRALQKFQKTNNLPVTGEIDAQTRDFLLTSLAGTQQEDKASSSRQVMQGALLLLKFKLKKLGSQYKTLQKQGRYAEAIAPAQELVKIAEIIFGPEDPATATYLNNLAALYYSLGAYAKAEPLFKRALAIREKVLGPEHPDTVTYLNNLAELYKSLGAYAKAEPLYKRALAIREKVLGPEHPDTATSLNNLAFLNISQGRIDQAMAHFRTTGSHAGLGCCYLARREYKAAQKEFTRELPLVRDRAGAEEAMIADLIGLGLADEGMADMAGAVSAFQEAVDRIEASTRPCLLRPGAPFLVAILC